MILLTDCAPLPRWETIATEDGDFQVHITPPSYEQWVRTKWQSSLSAEILGRLECVTGWRDVFQPMPNGGKAELPFSRDAFAAMLRRNPSVFEQIGKLIKPLFDGPSDEQKATAEKNSVPPSTETAHTTA